MAIIPEAIKKKEEKFSLSSLFEVLGRALFKFSLLFLIVVSGLSVAGFFYNQKLVTQDNLLKSELEKIKQEGRLDQAQQFLILSSQLKSLRDILTNHVYSSGFFAFIENATHPKVYFGNANIDLKNRTVSLSGHAGGYTVLAEQILAWENNNDITSISVPSAVLEKEGGVSFNVQLEFKKSIILK